MTVDVQGLRALLAKATPGPWSVTLNQGSIRPIGDTRRIAFGHDGNMGSRLADWNLIVAAVNALPELLDALTAAREGWRMVPVEPTPEMVEAWSTASPDLPATNWTDEQCARADWSAMLAVVPTQPPSDADVTHG